MNPGINLRHHHGAALVVGLILLALMSLLGLAAAGTGHLELQLARNEQFRENAASAASAGIEIAISRIVSSPAPDFSDFTLTASLPGEGQRFEVAARLQGHEGGMPQLPGASLVGAHVEILSTGHSLRHAVDRQRAIVMLIGEAPSSLPGEEIATASCEPLAPGVPCLNAGQLQRLSWQRLP